MWLAELYRPASAPLQWESPGAFPLERQEKLFTGAMQALFLAL